MTDEELDAIKARVEKATEGPWCWENCGEKGNDLIVGIALHVGSDEPCRGQVPPDSYDEHRHEYVDAVARKSALLSEMATSFDAAFIAHARADIPALIAEVERLREALLRIVAEAESDDDLTVSDGADIARAALAGKEANAE